MKRLTCEKYVEVRRSRSCDLMSTKVTVGAIGYVEETEEAQDGEEGQGVEVSRVSNQYWLLSLIMIEGKSRKFINQFDQV